MQVYKLHILIFLLFLYSCGSKENTSKKNVSDSTLIKSTDTAVNPELSKAKGFYKHFYIRNSSPFGLAKLDSLIYRYDSLQIRLWEIGGLFGYRQLYLIKRTGSVWTGFYFEMAEDSLYADGKEYINGPIPYDITKMRKVKPGSGWANFIDSLVTLNLMSLPDMDEIPGMKITWTDESSTFVEVTGKDFYRFYQYSEPNRFEEKFWQAEKMSRIESLFYTELIK